MDFNLVNIQNLLGDEFVCSMGGNSGNIKADFARLKKGAAQNFSDEERCRLLVQAADRLKEAGLEYSIKLTSYNNKSGEWTAWPHVWVNKTATASKNADDALAIASRTEARLAQLMDLLAKSQQLELPTQEPKETIDLNETEVPY